MATTSTMAAWRAAFVTAMQAAGGLSGVQVSYGIPSQPRKELVVLGKTSDAEHEDVALKTGRRTREETYRTQVSITVTSKHTPTLAETRAVAILAEIEDLLADDPIVGAVDGVLWAVPRSLEMDTVATTENATCDIDFEIEVKARLT